MSNLSNRLKDKSIEYLKKYIKTKRKRKLSKQKIEQIEKLIIKKRKGLDQLATQILESPLYKLAETEIIREGYQIKKAIIIEDQIKYEIPPSKTLLMMLKIVDTANQQGQQKKLNEYCEGFNTEK